MAAAPDMSDANVLFTSTLVPNRTMGRPSLDRFSDGTCIGAVLDRNGLRPSVITSLMMTNALWRLRSVW